MMRRLFADESAPFASEAAVLAAPAPGPYHSHGRNEKPPRGFSSQQPLVAAWFWYNADDASGAFLGQGDNSPALGVHPLRRTGYTYKRAAWHREQLEQMAGAGVDLLLADYWGHPANTTPGSYDHWSIAGLKTLVAAAEGLRKAGNLSPGSACSTKRRRWAVTRPAGP